MSFFDSVLVAIFCMSVVFIVLGLLWAMIRLFSIAIAAIEKRTNKASNLHT
ncbi:MAG TPA: OadG family protein [Clostridiales bacterium]|nr:OadG family protein [Clostridiales bacterium]